MSALSNPSSAKIELPLKSILQKKKFDQKNWKVNSSRALETYWIAEVVFLLSCSSACCTNVLWVSYEPLDFFKVFNVRNHFAQVLFMSWVSLHSFHLALSGSSCVNIRLIKVSKIVCGGYS